MIVEQPKIDIKKKKKGKKNKSKAKGKKDKKNVAKFTGQDYDKKDE